jgi:hypothetical protein
MKKQESYIDRNTKGRLDYQEKVNGIMEIFHLNFWPLNSSDNGLQYNEDDINNFLNEVKDYLMKHMVNDFNKMSIQSDEINESINKLKSNFKRFL